MGGRAAGIALATVVVAAGGNAWGAGLEKATLWSGRYAATGGAAASWVTGPEALAFNPAGLAASPMLGLSLNFSPTFSEFKGPINSGEQLTSSTGFKPVFGALASYSPFARLGIGLGAFVAGGTNAKFEDVSFANLNPNFDQLRPTFLSELSIIDLSLGAGFEVLQGLRIGAAYRVSFVSAHLQTAAPVGGPPPAALIALDFKDLTATEWTGVRVGAQYEAPSLLWGAGVNWRSPVNFSADGKVGEQFEVGQPGAPVQSVPERDVTVKAQFPSQIQAGGWVNLFNRRLRLIGQYDFTNYSVDKQLTFVGTFTVPGAPPTQAPIPPLVLNWDDQHNVRVGAEFTGIPDWALRAGYVWTSQVTPSSNARATIASPGFGTSFLAGAGWRGMGERLFIDGAFEYAFASGHGVNEFGFPGEFSTNAFVLHASVGYAWR